MRMYNTHTAKTDAPPVTTRSSKTAIIPSSTAAILLMHGSGTTVRSTVLQQPRNRLSRATRALVRCSGIRARWCLDARYGYKQDATQLLQEWVRDIGSVAGITAANTRLSSGSIGAPESRLELEVAFDSVSDWELFLSRIPFAEHKAWSQRIQAMVVDGSPRWEVLRVIPLAQPTSSTSSAAPTTSLGLPPLGLSPAPTAPTGTGSSRGGRASSLFIPQGLGAGSLEDLLAQMEAAAPPPQPAQPPSSASKPPTLPAQPPAHAPPSPPASLVHGVDLSAYPEGSEVVLDWKGDPMIIKPGDKMPKFL